MTNSTFAPRKVKMGEVMSSSITLRIIGPSELEGDLTLQVPQVVWTRTKP